MNHYFVLLVAIFLICLFSCNPSGGEENGSFLLSYEDASCIEGWIKIDAGAVALPADITLLRDSKPWRSIKLTEKVSEVMLDTLTPNTTYNLRGEIKQGSIYYKTNDITFKTLDTTSHNFSWQTWTFGEAGSSTLNDVAIINENDIWAVGEIYKQGDPILYNAVHWDGSKWELKRITVYYNGRTITAPLYSVFAFGKNDIWLSSGIPVHGDGNSWQQYHLFDMGILGNNDGYLTKIWGSSSNNIYFVGVNGSVAHYNGTSWKKIESGTTLRFYDIFGSSIRNNQQAEVLAVCSSNIPLNKAIYLIDKDKATSLSTNQIPWELFSIWFVSNRHYYAIGDGIYEKRSLKDTAWKDNKFDITHYASTGIDGNGLNDIFICGAYGDLNHFNGVSWKNYIEETGKFYGSFSSVAVKNNLVIVVGYEKSKAKILIGKR